MKRSLVCCVIFFVFALSACKEAGWKPGIPLAKGKLKIGVMYSTDPFRQNSGLPYAHGLGVLEMQKTLGLRDDQILNRADVNDMDPLSVESVIRDFIAQGVNLIFAASWGYMDTCEKLAQEFPSVIFAHATGYKYNDSNFTTYFGRVYQARYLSGVIAGMKTKTGRIGYVAAMGKQNSQVASGLNAFALGVERVNPEARVYVKVTYSWFDSMGEVAAVRALIGAGCDIITQHCNSAIPQIEAEKAGVFGIGYNNDMYDAAPNAVLTSVVWNWEVYCTALVQSIIDGSFTTQPYFGSLKDGLVGLAPLNKNFPWEARTLRALEEERQRIESGEFDVFDGILETNDGKRIGKAGESLSDDEIKGGINWYYRTVIEL
ncbi:MAG: BMP family ABC transporter substrate-binding protein [Spirochaetota bacterium]|nr:BMP family ABC transporter substrate-binding protein [Spirochaetota bacterium]